MILISLSPKKLISEIISSFNSLIKRQIYTVFLAVYPNTIYCVLVVDMDTILCFLLFHETTTPLKKKKCLMTDFQSSRSPTKLLSTYPIRFHGDGSLGSSLLGL